MKAGDTVSSASNVTEDEATQPKTKTPQGWQKFWTKEMTAAKKRNRKFLSQGNNIVRRYLDERSNDSDLGDSGTGTNGRNTPASLNLFFTNITTLQAMLFGQTPKIDVSREHADPDDDIARVAAVLYQRMLTADTYPGCDDLGTCLRAALQDRLLPGLGMARVLYKVDSDTEKVSIELPPPPVPEMPVGMPPPGMPPQGGMPPGMPPPGMPPQGGMPPGMPPPGGMPPPMPMAPPPPQEVEVAVNETCDIVYVHWQDVRWGWARTWGEVPWLAFRSYLTKEEVTSRFGADHAEELEYVNQMPSGEEKNNDVFDPDQMDNVQKAEVWEIWHKLSNCVFWWSDACDKTLDKKDDPYKLEGFYPAPRPLVANTTTTLFRPKGDFTFAQDLYNEVDVLQYRIQMITKAIKVVGVYDKNAGDSVGRMLTEGTENTLIPVDNWAMFAEKGGLQGVIDWFPVQEVVGVLQTLTGIRDQTIELLYQITGMSDILRGGNTEQYAAAGTQALKAKFGSIRVQALQDDFARFASDLDALKAEIISKHFDDQTILVQSNAQFLPEADKPKIIPALKLMKSPGVKWRVTIKPESIALIDYAQLKSERTEFLTAMATFLQSSQSMVQAVPGSLPVLLELLKWGMAGFKGSDYLEGIMDTAIEKAKNAPPPDDGEKKAEQAAQQAAQQMAQQEHANDMEKLTAKTQADLQLVQQKNQASMELERQKHQAKMEAETTAHQLEMKVMMEEFKKDMMLIKANLEADIQTEEAQSTYAAGEEAAKHDNKMTEIAANGAMAASREQGDGEE